MMDVLLNAVDLDGTLERLDIVQRHDHGYESDLLVAQWWARLRFNGDLDRSFHASVHPLGAFLAMFREQAALYYVTNKYGICFAAWYERAFDGAFFGVWIEGTYRGTTRAAGWLDHAVSMGFANFPVLISVTKREEVAALMPRLGYTALKPVPLLWGSAVHVGYLTAETYRSPLEPRKKRGA